MRGGPRGFRPGFPCPAVLRYFRSEAVQFRLRGRYPLRRAVPCTSPTTQLCNSPTRRQTDQLKPYNPPVTTAAAYHVTEVWALPFSLATTQGVEVSFLSSGYLDVSVPQLASPCPMYSGTSTTRITTWWVSPFGNPGVKGWSAPHPGLSQPPTSFFGSWRQGIHRVPLVLLIVKNSYIAAMEFSRCARARSPNERTPATTRPVSQNSTANVFVRRGRR